MTQLGFSQIILKLIEKAHKLEGLFAPELNSKTVVLYAFRHIITTRRQNKHTKEQSVVLLVFALDFFWSFAVNTLFWLLFSFWATYTNYSYRWPKTSMIPRTDKNTISQQNFTIQNPNERLNIVNAIKFALKILFFS